MEYIYASGGYSWWWLDYTMLQSLKAELGTYGMSRSGAKMELVERLYQAYKSGAIP